MTAAAAPLAPGAPAAELRRGTSAVRVAVAPGAPVVSFIADGHDWCAAAPWFDRAPSAAACALPTFVAGVAGAKFPAGGLLAVEEPVVEVHADGGPGAITAVWPPSRYPLTWTRTITLEPDGAVLARYTVTNSQRTPMPFLWNLPIGLPWHGAVRIDLPRGVRARVATSSGAGLPAAGAEFAWPALRDGGKLVDLSHPAQLGARRSVLCFVEVPRARVTVRVGNAVLDLSADPDIVTHARIWVNNDADAPDAPKRHWWRRHQAVREVSVGLSLGAPDALSDATAAWRTARWVDQGETLQWDVRLRPVPPAE